MGRFSEELQEHEQGWVTGGMRRRHSLRSYRHMRHLSDNGISPRRALINQKRVAVPRVPSKLVEGYGRGASRARRGEQMTLVVSKV
jgi:hypothetical protein